MNRPYLHSLLYVSRRRAQQICVLLLVFLSGLTFLAWKTAQDHADRDLKRLTRVAAQEVADRIELFMVQHIRALDRQSLHWLDGAPQSERAYVARTAPLLDVYPGFQAVNWINMERVIAHVAPIQGNLAALGADLSRHPVASRFLDSVISTGDLKATRPVDLLQGGRGFAVYQPVRARNGDIIGLLNGVFRISAVMSEVTFVNRSAWYGIRLSDGDSELYISDAGLVPGPLAGTANLRVADRTWTLVLEPDGEWLAMNREDAEQLVLIAGGLLTVLTTVLSYLVLITRSHSGLIPGRFINHETKGALVVSREGGLIEDVSDTAAGLIGLPGQELSGLSLLDICPDHLPDGSDPRARIAHLLERHEPTPPEPWALQGGSGEVLHCEINVERVGESATTLLLRRVDKQGGLMNRSRDLATHDPLTGLPNRALVLDRLAQSIAVARRQGGSVAMMVVEVVNPVLFPDPAAVPERETVRLLRGIASRLRGGLREMDTLGRLGGARFAIIATEVDQQYGAGQLAVRLHEGFSDPVDRGGENVAIQAAIGIALYPADTRSAEQLLNNAGSALQRAKLGTGLPVGFFSRSQTDALHTHHREAQALRAAIQDGDLDLRWLQRRHIRDARPTGYAVELGWRRPHGGILNSKQVVELAERSGLLVELALWMVHAVRNSVGRGTAPDGANMPVSLSLSLTQLLSEEIHTALTLPRSDQEVNSMALEVDIEAGLTANFEAARSGHLTRLVQEGVVVNLVGFCDGACDPRHLTDFGVRRLKFSTDAVRRAMTDSSDAKLVRAMTGMARELNILTVAIGVGESADIGFLETLGFDEFQMAEAYVRVDKESLGYTI